MTAISHYYDYFHGQSTVSCTAHRMYDVFDTYDCYLVGTTIITVIIMVSLLFLMCTPYDCHIPQALCYDIWMTVFFFAGATYRPVYCREVIL
jgi:hypothetical protein